MNCNAFCLYLGEEASLRIQRLIKNVDRWSKEVIVTNGERTSDASERLRETGYALAAYSVGGEQLPVVHGFMSSGEGYPSGEFAFIDSREDDYLAGRDLLGTRPLYVHRSGSLCAASDHRFLKELGGGELLPPGCSIMLKGRTRIDRVMDRERFEAAFDEAASNLARLISESVERRVGGRKKVGVAFSGGLDSSVVAWCAAKHAEVTLCSTFSEGSRDEQFTKDAADALGLPLVSLTAGREDLLAELRSLDLPFPPTEMDLALWCLYSMTSRVACENGCEVILLGQLADELFGGYQKYARTAQSRGAVAAESMMINDLAECGRVGLVRDEQACARYLEPRFPFSDDKIARFALGLPFQYKIEGKERKKVLRQAGSLLGVPQAIVEGPKKAAQYSSGLAKLLP